MAHAGGRPTDLTPEVIEDVRRILPTVLYLETVADYVGVSRRVVRKWIVRGGKERRRIEKGGNPDPREAIYVEFVQAYKKALAEGELYDTGIIKKAAATQWQAAAWRLERRFPDRWGRKDRGEPRDRDLEQTIKSELAKLVEAGTGEAACASAG